MKKLVSFVLSLAMLLTLNAAFAEEPAPLQFKADGTFKIMVLADTHIMCDGKPYNEKMTEYLSKVMEGNRPDLIVLLGDNIHEAGTDTVKATEWIDSLMTALDSFGIPVAMVFGNHDAVGKEAKDAQVAAYAQYDCFVGCIGVGETTSGNYNLPVLSSDGTRTAFNLWFFDNGTSAVPDDVIAWYVETSNGLKAQNDGNTVPSLVFQHIILSQIFDALVADDSKYGYSLPEGNDGIMGEKPAPYYDNAAQFAAHLQQGDVLAAINGHEHENAFVVNHQGIDIVNVPTWSRLGYFGPKTRSVTFIDLNESDLWHYETYRLKPQDVGLAWTYGLALPEQTITTAQ